MKLGEAIYKDSQSKGETSGSSKEGGSDDSKVVDADFEEVNDDKDEDSK